MLLDRILESCDLGESCTHQHTWIKITLWSALIFLKAKVQMHSTSQKQLTIFIIVMILQMFCCFLLSFYSSNAQIIFLQCVFKVFFISYRQLDIYKNPQIIHFSHNYLKCIDNFINGLIGMNWRDSTRKIIKRTHIIFFTLFFIFLVKEHAEIIMQNG